MRIRGLLLALLMSISLNGQDIFPGEAWLADDGEHINVHGGGMLYYNGKYYWFGESRAVSGTIDRTRYGVGCYSSSDLVNWHNEGLALRVINDTSSLLQPGCLIERPKVIYNEKTGKFVMWFHHELKGQGYKAALTGVAVSENITGPYTYLKSMRPNAGRWPVNFSDDQKKDKESDKGLKAWTDDWKKEIKDGLFVRRDFRGGQMSRDMTLFKDENGDVWHIHSAEENMTLHFSLLTDDYLDFTGIYYRVLPGESNEAPAVFRQGKYYYMISSGTTGWDPNPARLSISRKITGPWKALENPCRGTDLQNKTTFHSQSTYIFKPEGKKSLYIFMGDRWKPRDLADSKHIWLPVEWEKGYPVLKWKDKWNLNDYK